MDFASDMRVPFSGFLSIIGRTFANLFLLWFLFLHGNPQYKSPLMKRPSGLLFGQGEHVRIG